MLLNDCTGQWRRAEQVPARRLCRHRQTLSLLCLSSRQIYTIHLMPPSGRGWTWTHLDSWPVNCRPLCPRHALSFLLVPWWLVWSPASVPETVPAPLTLTFASSVSSPCKAGSQSSVLPSVRLHPGPSLPIAPAPWPQFKRAPARPLTPRHLQPCAAPPWSTFSDRGAAVPTVLTSSLP